MIPKYSVNTALRAAHGLNLKLDAVCNDDKCRSCGSRLRTSRAGETRATIDAKNKEPYTMEIPIEQAFTVFDIADEPVHPLGVVELPHIPPVGGLVILLDSEGKAATYEVKGVGLKGELKPFTEFIQDIFDALSGNRTMDRFIPRVSLYLRRVDDDAAPEWFKQAFGKE